MTYVDSPEFNFGQIKAALAKRDQEVEYLEKTSTFRGPADIERVEKFVADYRLLNDRFVAEVRRLVS